MRRTIPRGRSCAPRTAAVLAAAALAGRGESPSGLPDPPAGDRGAAAAVVSEAVFRDGRDGGGLPPWEEVFAAMDAPGCVAHFRKVDGSYVAREYRLRYRGAALGRRARWSPLAYTVNVAASVRTEDGGVRELPVRVGIRAVCRRPASAAGRSAAAGFVERLLAERGLSVPSAAASARAVPEAGGSPAGGWASALARAAAGLLLPRPLLAQECVDLVCPEIVVTVSPDPCPLGFDREEDTGECVENFVGEGTGGGGGGGNGGSGGSGGGSDPPAPPDPSCTDDQVAIADEYDDPANWPCDVFTDSVLDGGDHRHETGYLSPDYLSGRGVVLSAVPAAWINSDWRCPKGNAAVGGVAESTHI